MELEVLKQKEELIQTNTAKDKFFSIVAHDLKNPLASLAQMSEFIMSDFKNIEESFSMFTESLKNTNKFLENLLVWSRSQMNSVVYMPIKVSLLNIIIESIDYLQAQSMAKNISIRLSNTLKECIVICDVNMIHTVLRNLLSNALKYSAETSIIEIEVVEYAEDTDYVQVSVKDTGIGIDANDISKIFKIEEKIISTKGTNNEEGTGLGLILCKEFIDKHNCKIWVESEKGKGTTFFFTLPKVMISY
jgi:signal transduction histidine kinase